MFILQITEIYGYNYITRTSVAIGNSALTYKRI
uniref:Uncharacterized protein n=1 Tax=Anguilla anguilla TaxID=7936 RepID=A0A0E9UD35_ANGAN